MQCRLAQAARYQRHSCGAALQLAAEVLTALHETGALQSSPAAAHALDLQLQELADVLASFSARWLILLAMVAPAWRSLCMCSPLIR